MKDKVMREKIINVAKDVFKRFGYRKTSIDMISGKIGVAKSLIYYYFKDKEEIFREIIEEEAKGIVEKIENALSGISDPVLKLKKYFQARMKYFLQFVKEFSSFKDEYIKEHNFVERIRKKYDEYEYKKIKEILEIGVKSKRFVIKNIEMTAFSIVAATKGLEYEIAMKMNNKGFKENIDGLIDILFYGIVKKEEENGSAY